MKKYIVEFLLFLLFMVTYVVGLYSLTRYLNRDIVVDGWYFWHLAMSTAIIVYPVYKTWDGRFRKWFKINNEL